MRRNLVVLLMLCGCVALSGCRGGSRSTDTGMTGHHDTFSRLESYPLEGPQQVRTGRRPSPEDPFLQAQMQQMPPQGPVPRTPPPKEGLFGF